MSRSKQRRKPNNPAKRAARRGTSDKLHLMMVESFKEDVHRAVALNARLLYERLRVSADLDAHENIGGYMMIVGTAIENRPELKAEHDRIESAGRALDDCLPLLEAGNIAPQRYLDSILVGVNTLDEIAGSDLVKTRDLYLAEKIVNQARKAQYEARASSTRPSIP